MQLPPQPPFPLRFVSLRSDLKVALRPVISLSGGRSGEKVKFLRGPANSAVKSEVERQSFCDECLGASDPRYYGGARQAGQTARRICWREERFNGRRTRSIKATLDVMQEFC